MPDPSSSRIADLERAPLDPDAAERVYRAYADDVLRYLLRHASPDEAADALAATFEDILDRRARFRRTAHTSPRAWIIAVARRRLIDMRRSQFRERAALGRLSGSRLLEPDDYAALNERIDAMRLAPALEAAIAELTPTESEMFLLVVSDELSPSEAAKVLGTSAVAGRNRLSRARRHLRAYLDSGPAATSADAEVLP